MTDQYALWAEPLWTDQYAPGDTVRDIYLGQHATVVDVDPGSHVRVRFTDHPYHGTYECTYGHPTALEPLATEGAA